MDNDGDDDILPIECNVSNVESIFSDLEENLDYGDQLFIHASGHGFNDLNDPDKYYLGLWEQELLSNYELADMLDQISCSSITISLAYCYSGGFKDELLGLSSPERINLLTCRNNLQYVRNSQFMQYAMMDTYEYFLITALRGWHPDYANSAPWIRMSEIGENYDFYSLLDLIKMDPEQEVNYDKSGGNNNDIQEIQESINYTSRYCAQFNDFGVKEYDCGFITEDLQSLTGISGKVESTQTLSGNFLICGDLSIESGVELTLDNTASFHIFESSIIVKNEDEVNNLPGGVLRLDGATLTNVCDSRWNGVQVWGTSDKDQFSHINQARSQGILIANSAVIENAYVAVQLNNPESRKTSGGGIITATNTEFINNEISVYFPAYKNVNPLTSKGYNNLGEFKNCDFVINKDYITSTDSYEGTQVKINSVDGIKFYGCNFINDYSTLNQTGRAIHSLDGGFEVNAFEEQRGVFTGFQHAIECSNPIRK